DKYLSHVGQWIDSIAEVDVFVSFATYSFNNPSNVKAEIMPNGSEIIIDAQGVYHPFLSKSKAVANDFKITRKSISIVTGANMAGKSTMLRTVGLTYIIANNGMPVCATSFKCSVVSLFSSMRTTDNISKDISYFNAELIRLKKLINYVKNNAHTLIILDEILKGTNSKDKLKGSVMFLNEISKHSVSAIIATHDLELSKLEDERPDIYKNYCFEIELAQEINYSYKIQRGVARNLNASYLLEGIIKEMQQ
ncbi:MAG: DNA mismatch repair protein MutS, partial [Bacteroides sp.]|nr:DNA mismatch repair protein MutS [Bacteroides sp.]